MKKTKVTCGELYIDAFKKYGKTESDCWAFSAGFVGGQCEKVYLGACRAAMFRPSPDTTKPMMKIIRDMCRRYELEHVDVYGEIWVVRKGFSSCVEQLFRFEKNSIGWHTERAYLCGVPDKEVDVEFHKRTGYGKFPKPKKAKPNDK